ncbi:hypothetical protein TruAng_011265 [Truncatella angustata]|nr:hypothetical protein TruAng_011265 [Truncatella angustata]
MIALRMVLMSRVDHTAERERPGRRRPFSTWVKKLTNFKNGSSSTDSTKQSHSKRDHAAKPSKRRPSKQNNPYPESGCIASSRHHSQPSLSTTYTGVTSNLSTEQSRTSMNSSVDGHAPTTAGGLSMAGTDHEASHSINAPSHMASSVAGTSRTANGRRGGDSTFSSPSPSVRSLTTTLTTIQSMAVNPNSNQGQSSSHHHGNNNNSQNIQFSQPFPTASPASAIPAHLAPHVSNHPTTYQAATANNLLSDDASILTLASSSKRRRRRSFDTDASVRALAPSSVWGASRESLPLSVLSANIDGVPATPSLHQTASRMGPAAERNSLYSTTGIVPALPSERNSFYAKQSIAGDGASVRSGFMGHGRADSINGSVAGVTSPLASPLEVAERDHVAEIDEMVKERAPE